MEPIIAYHFTGERLRDGRPIPAVGEALRHDGPIVWCKSGLYASPTPWGALYWAPTDSVLLHRVECEEIDYQTHDKIVCRQRTIRASIDATHLLRRFAADQALSVAHLWDMPDVVREYLTKLDESLRMAAWAAARREAAPRNAAWAAARDVAREAATSLVAREAALAASRDVARDAGTRNVAWEAAWAAAREAAAADFNRRAIAALDQTDP